jgi:hypothetical protein
MVARAWPLACMLAIQALTSSTVAVDGSASRKRAKAFQAVT